MESLVEGQDFGEGICPNCGTKGTVVGTHESVVGDDPNQDVHDAIAAKVADPKHPLNPEDAQNELLAAVTGNTAATATISGTAEVTDEA